MCTRLTNAPSHVQGDCPAPKDKASAAKLLPKQCMIKLSQPLLNPQLAPTPLILLNLYIEVADGPGGGGSVVTHPGGRLWMRNMTFEALSSETFATNGSAIHVLMEGGQVATNPDEGAKLSCVGALATLSPCTCSRPKWLASCGLATEYAMMVHNVLRLHLCDLAVRVQRCSALLVALCCSCHVHWRQLLG